MKELIEDVENKLVKIKKRLKYLQAIEAEFSKHVGKSKFVIQNDIIHRMTWDSYDMVVIDLASLCNDMKGRGGFFNQLNNHVKKFKKPKLKTLLHQGVVLVEDDNSPTLSATEYEIVAAEISKQLDRQIHSNEMAAFERLFPPLKLPERTFFLWKVWAKVISNDKITPAHINALKERFSNLTQKVVSDRNSRRAHRYEPRKSDKDTEMLSIHKIREQFEQVEEIINDIRAITIGGSYVYNPPLNSNPSSVANDIVDMVMYGSIQMIFNRFEIGNELEQSKATRKFYRQFRDEFYQNNSDRIRRRLISTLKKRFAE